MKHIINKIRFKSRVKKLSLFAIGIVFLMLAKVKNTIQGYSSPKPFSTSEHEKCIEYDINVVNNWMLHLYNYLNNEEDITLENKTILELGPGSDLGIGLYLLSKKVKKYNAIDVNNLVESVPKEFYENFFNHLKHIDNNADITFLMNQLDKTRNGKNDRLNYICRDDFDIVAALGSSKIDIVFSQAAFEHLDNVDDTIRKLSQVAISGSVIVAEIDLKTHSRWIRDKDPNNIYRYPEWLYRIFNFRGIPNRIRPYQYKEIFEKYGWGNITIEPLNLFGDDNYKETKNSLSRKFLDEKNQMSYLSIMLCATRL